MLTIKDFLIGSFAFIALLCTMSFLAHLDEMPDHQIKAAQETDQAIADEIKGQREQRAEFNRLAAEAERMTGMKAGMK
jgi:hypothetical protein